MTKMVGKTRGLEGEGVLPSKTKIMKVETGDLLVMDRTTQIQGRHLSLHARDT